ncbi:hypothetical protein K432DRAFT_53791 [Lepidopterella palustris CBS 459.81]|uniref:Uncharacterized protein n=1 Tax=Lepidopterella palustris CBS 459.81 TaxID=1314670 RepID=A0A8E2EA35_9PEZI|nr:hypothetical protein K432DRAFT_53791 [Lepidopterella palustris CBS 459.81]
MIIVILALVAKASSYTRESGYRHSKRSLSLTIIARALGSNSLLFVIPDEADPRGLGDLIGFGEGILAPFREESLKFFP